MRRHLFLKLIITFVLMFNSWNAGAANTPSQTPSQKLAFRSNWSQTEKLESSYGEAKVSLLFRERFLNLRGNAVSVASITTGEIRSDKEQGFPTDFAGAVQKLVKIKKWKQETRGSYRVFESALPEQGRYVKIFISKEKGVYKYSMAMIRLAYMFPTYFETELIQREDIGDVEGVAQMLGTPNKFAIWFSFLIEPARAIGLTWLVDYLTNWQSIAGNGVSAVGSVGQGLQSGASAITTGATTASNAITSASSTASNALIRSSGNITGAADRFTAVLGSKADAATLQMRNINNTFKSFQDPKTMAKMGLGFGAGATAGAALMGLVIHLGSEGLSRAASAAFYAYTGDIEPENLAKLNDRKGAWGALHDLADRTALLDISMQRELVAMAYLTQLNPMTPDKMDRDIEDMEGRIGQIREKMKTTYDQNTREMCFDKVVQMKKVVDGWKSILPVLREQYESGNPEKQMCSKFSQMYDSWVATEAEIEKARSIIKADTSYAITSASRAQTSAATSVITPRQATVDCNKTFAEERNIITTQISMNACICSVDPAVITPNCSKLCVAASDNNNSLEECLARANIPKNNSSVIDDISSRNRVIAKETARLGRAQDQLVNRDSPYRLLKTNMNKNAGGVLSQCGLKVDARMADADAKREEARAMATLNNTQPLAAQPVSTLPTPSTSFAWLNSIKELFLKPVKWITGG